MLENIHKSLSQAISNIEEIQEAGISGENLLNLLERPKNSSFGDIALPCFIIAKKLKIPPPKAAALLADKLLLPNSISKVQVTGPFLNFSYKRSELFAFLLDQILFKEDEIANLSNNSNQTILLEYSSPNIAKPYHVGHLRTTLIGNSLDKVYKKLGYNVISIDHLGDWGTQFGFVWAGCKLWGKPKEPKVASLVELYRKATALRKKQEEDEDNLSEEERNYPLVNDIARNYFLDLEKGLDYAKDFWSWCREISLDYLKKTDARIGVSFDHYIGESFYSEKLKDVENSLQEKSLLTNSQGALGVDLGEELGFARITTEDGRSLYLSRDIATILWRKKEFDFDKTVYVVGAPQKLHFQQLFSIAEKLDPKFKNSLEHVDFGHVKGMSTRAGGFIELNEFIDEAKERALNAYKEQVSAKKESLEPEKIAEAVGKSAIIFSTLSKTRTKDVEFSWDKALAFQGDSGPYLLYALARINSIEQKAKEKGIIKEPNFKSEYLSEESAWQLLLYLKDQPAALLKTKEENDPFYLASYCLELAKAFSKAYNELKITGEEKEIAQARLNLFLACKKILKESLELLGLETLERM